MADVEVQPAVRQRLEQARELRDAVETPRHILDHHAESAPAHMLDQRPQRRDVPLDDRALLVERRVRVRQAPFTRRRVLEALASAARSEDSGANR